MTKEMSRKFENILKVCGQYSYRIGTTGDGKMCVVNFSDFKYTILGKENVYRFLNESENVKNPREMKKLFVRIATAA